MDGEFGLPEPEDKPADKSAMPQRDRDLLGRKNSKLRRKLDEMYDRIMRGWEDQADRSDAQMDWWNCFNCILDQNQFYNGNAEIYVPIVRDAVTARATRFTNQLFPNSGRYVEVVSADGKQPMDIVALLDHYIRRSKLKTKVAKPLSINGDVEGQYNLYVDWNQIDRWVVSRETHAPTVTLDGTEVEGEGEEFEDVTEEEIAEGFPLPEVLHDSDVLVLPATVDSIEEALEKGGLVVIVRRWSRAGIEAMIDAGEVLESEGEDLLEQMKGAADGKSVDAEKKLAEAVGIRAKGDHCVGWEVWHKFPLSAKGEYDPEGDRRLCRAYYGPDRRLLGAKRNPYWNDLCPLLSEPVVKVAGVFKGKSLVEPVAPMQYEANDAVNEGADSAHYSAMPLVRKSANVNKPIILNLGAILEAEQGELEMLTFPDLTPRMVTRVQIATTQIFQTLGINPSMLPQQTSQAKRNQAQVALEQQVDILTTAEAVSVMEEGLFTPLMGWFVDLDHQFRDRPLSVRMFGVAGHAAEMQDVPVLQNRARYEFRWWGVEQARNAAQLQQMFMGINVMRGLKPDLMAEGYRLKLGPLIEVAAMSMFGARMGSQVLEDMRHQSSLDPELENGLIAEGHEVPVQPLDDDKAHIQTHMRAGQETGDPLGQFKMHIQAHLRQMQQKVAAQAQQAMQQMMQQGGRPQGRPGQANGARPGAMPAGPRGQPQGPPGMIRPDNILRAGGIAMPRKM